MSKIWIYPYSSGSESAKLLADRLSAKRIKLSDSSYEYKSSDLVINWGNSRCPYPCLNVADSVAETVDKLKFFRLMTRKGYRCLLPKYWVHPDDIPAEDFPVFCRTTTTGCDGAGIVIAKDRTELVPADLYTSFIPEGTEYRVTAFKGQGVTDIQTKLPRLGENPHPMIKTFANGWGFQRKPVTDGRIAALTSVINQILDVAGLDFCGADLIIDSNGDAYVLEVNTAMGLEGDALERFAQAVERYCATLVAEEPVNTLYGASEGNLEGIPKGILSALQEKRRKDVIEQSYWQIAAEAKVALLSEVKEVA